MTTAQQANIELQNNRSQIRQILTRSDIPERIRREVSQMVKDSPDDITIAANVARAILRQYNKGDHC